MIDSVASPVLPCIYRGNANGQTAKDGQGFLACSVYGQCVPQYLDGVPTCEGCHKRLAPDAPKFAQEWQDQLVVHDRTHTPTHALRGLLAGRPAFLLCGGPSTAQQPLELLQRRGCWTMAVNNVAGARVRPQAFVCSDPPLKFSHCIWLDPGIMKFVPNKKFKKRGRGTLRRKVGEKEWKPLPGGTISMPNTWGFGRRSWMRPDESFFTDTEAAWGNHDEGVAETKEDKTVCTMLLGMRLLRYLGAGTIFLLGVDFYMTPEAGYSFAQARDVKAARSNNQHFAVVNDWLCRMRDGGVFERFGVRIYNCNQASGLRAFLHVPFERAVEVACKDIEAVPDLSGWYDDKKITK